ncbi:MAG: hypothetical protein NTW07_08390 [candidate division Zixibacteria bacterium]|nr:hypothetical protein [candidate division Zixibacteria bacterium]
MRTAISTLLKSTAAVCLVIILTGSALAYTGTLQIPPEGTTQKITLEDGTTLIGKITEIRADQIKFQTDLGEMTIVTSKITKIEEIKESKEVKPTEEVKKTEEVKVAPAAPAVNEKDWFPNPNRTRLLIGQNARSLKAGDGYFFDLWLFFPGLAYGITDNISISGGVSILPDVDDQLFYFTPKFGFPAAENLDLALNVTVFRLWEETFYFGLGNMTYGTDDQSVTLGLGLGWNDERMMEKPVVTGGGEYRVDRRLSLVGEGWFIPGENEDGMLFFGGIRFLGKDDEEEDEDESDFLPYLDFVWNF